MKTRAHSILVVIVLCITLALTACGSLRPIMPETTEAETTEVSNTEITEAVTNTYVEYSRVFFDKSNTLYGPLALVNDTHEYTFPAQASQSLVSIWEYRNAHTAEGTTSVYKVAWTDLKLDGDAAAALHEWLTDFYKATGKNDIVISAAYRTYEEQEGFAVPAGKSNHHTGYGVTLKVYDGENTKSLTENAAYYDWLVANAHKYGFVVRYPDNKSAITGISDYLDHFHYVGCAPAAYMKQNNLCLEEFVEGIKTDNPLVVTDANGQDWMIFYLHCPEEGQCSFELPAVCEYTVSGDNDGGCIVCVSVLESASQQ